MLQSLPVLNYSKNSRPTLSHLRRIPLHNLQIRTHSLSEINLVHNQQIRARDARATLAGDLVSARNINHVDDEVGQFARVVRSQVVTAGLDEEQVRGELLLEGLEG